MFPGRTAAIGQIDSIVEETSYAKGTVWPSLVYIEKDAESPLGAASDPAFPFVGSMLYKTYNIGEARS
jgi:hypothetical protein